MARRYSVMKGVTATAGKNLLAVYATAAVRPRITDIIIGSSGTPADAAVEWYVQRVTSAGTTPGGSVTPAPLDANEAAAVAAANYGIWAAEPTAGTLLMQWGINQRATFRWVAAPGYELIAPATANNGISLMSNLVSAGFTAEMTMLFEE